MNFIAKASLCGLVSIHCIFGAEITERSLGPSKSFESVKQSPKGVKRTRSAGAVVFSRLTSAFKKGDRKSPSELSTRSRDESTIETEGHGSIGVPYSTRFKSERSPARKEQKGEFSVVEARDSVEQLQCRLRFPCEANIQNPFAKNAKSAETPRNSLATQGSNDAPPLPPYPDRFSDEDEE